MKLSFTLAAIGLLGLVAAHTSSKQVIISYPQDTPDSIVSKAKDALIAAGGIITHEYSEFTSLHTGNVPLLTGDSSSDQVCCPGHSIWPTSIAELMNQGFCSYSFK